MSKEAMKLALEALKYIEHNYMSLPAPAEKAITALREALAEQKSGIKQVIELYDSPDQPAQPQQDPFIYYRHYDGGTQDFPDEKTIPLYTSPPAQRTWVGLTDEEVIKTFNTICNGKPFDVERILELHRAIEAKLKEKNA